MTMMIIMLMATMMIMHNIDDSTDNDEIDDDVRNEEYENNKYKDYYNADDKTNDIDDGIGDYSDNSIDNTYGMLE